MLAAVIRLQKISLHHNIADQQDSFAGIREYHFFLSADAVDELGSKIKLVDSIQPIGTTPRPLNGRFCGQLEERRQWS